MNDLTLIAASGVALPDAVAAARAAFDGWSRQSGKARAAVLLQVADLIEADAEPMARIETLETGKPIAQERGEVPGAADLWRYAAALARTLHGDSHNTLGADMLGVVLKEPSRCGFGHVHRIDRRGQIHRGGGVGEVEEGGAGTGGQEPAGDFPGCGYGQCGGCGDVRHLFQCG